MEFQLITFQKLIGGMAARIISLGNRETSEQLT